MSESEKTEPPSQKKLGDARKKGDVAHSKDASKAFLLLGCIGYLIFAGEGAVEAMLDMLQWAGTHAYVPFDAAIGSALDMAFQKLVVVIAPFLGIVVFFGILGEILHVGFLFAPEKVQPSLQKLNVVSNLKNLFSLRNAIEAVKSILKVLVLTWVLWRIIRDNIASLILVSPAGIHVVGNALAMLLKAMLMATALMFVVLAGIDVLLQRFLFMRQQKMSKDEVKREYKEMEGNPEVKHQRRQIHRELAMEQGRAAVRRSSVVVTNPVHFAVALHYEAGTTPLPLVTAKGAGAYAQALIKEAHDAGIPVVEDVPLARALMAQAELDDYVPGHLLHAVVEVLRAVRDLAPDVD